MPKFTLNIDLGNAAMQTSFDVAGALRSVAEDLDVSYGTLTGDGGIYDDNGNRVGTFEFKGQSQIERSSNE